jgi:membrane-bound lytic murein transglycosylase MltF
MSPIRFPRAITCLLLLLVVAACSDNSTAVGDQPFTAAAESASTSAGDDAPAAEAQRDDTGEPGDPLERGAITLAKSWTGDLDVMEERRVVRILTVYGPGRYHLEDGRGEGIVAEMARLFEEHLNERLGKGHVKLHTVVIPVARDQLVPALLAGRGDVISAGMTITEERAAEIDFSIPVSKPLNEILVTGPTAPPVKTLEDLAGQTLYLRESSSYQDSVASLSEDFVSRGLEPIRIKAMPEALEDDDLIEMVNGGLLPWAVVDDYKPQLWKDVFENIVVRDDLVFREGGRLGWAMRKNSPLLKEAVDDFLRDNREGTLIGNIMRNRYIRNFDYAAHALDEDDYQRFSDLESLFRKYGEAYGIEYLFAAAQGYQESRLQQSMRSPAGAIGVMQLLPSTAADDAVGIPDISDLENNIHAGVKYMDYLRDRYFSDPQISPLNQALLALGAYNAGPARMIQLRRMAEEQGYDPNVWFDNVELVAAQEIGRETVQYVANIYRYYLTYRMVAMQELIRREAREAAGISASPDQET